MYTPERPELQYSATTLFYKNMTNSLLLRHPVSNSSVSNVVVNMKLYLRADFAAYYDFLLSMDGVHHLSFEAGSVVCSGFITKNGYYVISSSSESTLGR